MKITSKSVLILAFGLLCLNGEIAAQPILPDPNAPQISPQPSSAPAAAVSGEATATTTTTTTVTAPAGAVVAPGTTPATPSEPERPALSNEGPTVPGTENGTETGVASPVSPDATAATTPVAGAEAADQLYAVSEKTWADSQNINYRRIDTIKWPSGFLGVSEIREKYKELWDSRDLETFKRIFNEYCTNYALLYGAQVEKEWNLDPGTLSLLRVCEGLKALSTTATAADSYLFEYPNPLIMKKFDQATYEYYSSPLFKINEKLNNAAKTEAQEAAAAAAVVADSGESDSLFSMLGLPAAFVPFVTELLLLLALMLNFFLLYKVFKKQ